MKQINIFFLALFLIVVSVNSQEVYLGYNFSMLECGNGLWSAGDNSFGQLGHGNNISTNNFNLIQGMSDVKKVSSGLLHSLILDNLGNLYAVGFNQAGGLGNGSYVNSNTITQVLDPTGSNILSNIADIDCSESYASLASNSSGHVFEWGYLSNNSISLPRYVYKSQNTLLDDVVQVASGVYSRYALDINGHVWSWGENSSGSLGNGQLGTVIQPYAQQIQGLNDIVQISAGQSHLIALDRNGNVWAVGGNTDGELGNGSQNSSAVPIAVSNAYGNGQLGNIKYIETGLKNSFAVTVSGKAYAWGENDYGALGLGYSNLRVLLPSLIVGVDGIGTMIDVESINSNGETTILKSIWPCDIVGWGLMSSGLLGQFNQSTIGMPRIVDLSATTCCSPLGTGGTFAGFKASKTLICPGECVTVEALIASGNPTIENWIVIGGVSSISNTSGLTTQMCFDDSGDYSIWAQANGNTYPLMNLIHITVMSEDSRKCQFETNDNDNSMNRLAISELDNNIKIFPNPSSSLFNIRLKNLSVIKYEVKDIYGKLIKAASLDSNEQFKVDLTQQNTGVYFLSLYTENGNKSYKLIKK